MTSTPENEAERMQQIEDRFALMDLVTDYCAAIDDRDLEKFLALFTEDAVLRHRDGVMRLENKPAIRDYYTKRFTEYDFTFHYPHAHRIFFDGPEQARGTVSAHAEMSENGRLIVAAIRYTDRYRREGERWRFAERELAFWYYMPLADLPLGFADGLRKHYRGERIPADLPESLKTDKAVSRS
jgi:uncharacterized protein (TIGR02246 family)